ncbi:MAG: TIGR04211 family SH3 domain-containing protein [Gammaproteobacteria bacterium]|nr:TIGR04211 family SH3 domain-containing protein [Gammaproteobacteria bacterium]
MYRIILLLGAMLSFNIGTSSHLQAAESYVSDEIGVTMRSGPTNRYRVIGNLRAGTPIKVLQHDAENKTSEVSTLDGQTTGWIKTEYVSDKETVLAQYQALQTQAADLQQQVTALNQQLGDKNSIAQKNQNLQIKVTELENQVDQLSQQADLQKSRFRKDVFYAGALTVLISMFIAWLITRTAYGRRQRSGWR